MTSDEIRNYECPNDVSVQFWIREVALQLAVMNERNAPLTWTEAVAKYDMVQVALLESRRA